MIKLYLLSFLLSVHAAAAEPTTLFYFGGFGATQAQVNQWKEGASSIGIVHVYPYPAGANSSAESAVAVGRASILDAVNKINALESGRIVVVGHSSGSALSKAVARQVQDPQKIELVSLDGFFIDAGLRSRVKKASCWYAENRVTGLQSNNAGSMRGNCGSSAKKYNDNSHCRAQWCLHFSLVNKNAPADLGGGGDFMRRGYLNNVSNLEWLK
jgi:hypothetical protein